MTARVQADLRLRDQADLREIPAVYTGTTLERKRGDEFKSRFEGLRPQARDPVDNTGYSSILPSEMRSTGRLARAVP